MSAATDTWIDEAFFNDGFEDAGPDGVHAPSGAPWHSIAPRWGHSMHTMCSYHGMFPPKLAHYFIERFSQPGDVVLDPFSGRGTTTLQARVEGRLSIGNDLSPLAYVLSRAKSAPPTWNAINKRVDDLERGYSSCNAELDVHPDIEMLYHPNTLRQIDYLRSSLLYRPLSRWSQIDFMLAGAVAGILHGAHRNDGSSQYLSISMPNTFSMAPGYVEKFIREHDLKQIDQNVFECLRDKLARLYLDDVRGPTGKVIQQDAARLLSTGGWVEPDSIDLLVTSPPYLDVVNYGTSNWIRLWWLGMDEVARDAGSGRRKLDRRLDHRHNYESYVDFMRRVFMGTRRILKRSGVAVFVIGDVASPGGPSRPLAEAVWDDIGATTGLDLLEVIEDSLPVENKVSRIWGETKGKATNRDCVLVLGRDDGEPQVVANLIDWSEPYRDGGPDAAHYRVRAARKQCG